MTANPFAQDVFWHLGPIPIGRTVLTTWGMVMAIALGGLALRTRWRHDEPGKAQAMVEWLVEVCECEVAQTMRMDPAPFMPLLATLFVFILGSSVCALLPGLEAPTAAIETDLALTLLVFGNVLGWGVRRRGFWGYLRTAGQPSILALPLNLLEAVTRVVSMTVRLFGNMMSGMVVGAVVLTLAGLIVPVPFMALELLTGAIQAYIFTVLAMVFIAAAAGEDPPPNTGSQKER